MSEQAIERRMQDLRDLAGKYAKAQSERVYLEEFRRSKLAMLMQEAEGMKPKTTVSERESYAFAHPDYTDLLQSLKTAVEIAERTRWELKICEMGAELWRTKQANERAERKAYGA